MIARFPKPSGPCLKICWATPATARCCSNATATCLPSPTSWPSATALPPSLPERFSLMSDLATYQRDFVATLDAARDGHIALAGYRNTAIKGSVDALADNYPTIAAILGETAFLALAADF